MAIDAVASRVLGRIYDKLYDQAWFQKLKTKWEELDTQSRMYLSMAGVAAVVFAVIIVLLSLMLTARSLKKELAEKNDLPTMIQSASDEMRRLKEIAPAAQGGHPGSQDTAPWAGYFELLAAGAGIEKTSLTANNEKILAATEQAKETQYDLVLKHVGIKQVVKLAFSLENGAKPVKLRNLTIDTKSDPAGFMDATLSVSAFNIKQVP